MSSEEPTLYCANHPNVPTTLRCNRCEKPICSKCAIQTPTGYRCPECVRGQLKVFSTTVWYDYPLAIGLAGILSFLGSQMVTYLGFFTLFVAPVAGVVIAEAVRFVIRRRRSKSLFTVSAIAAALGSLPNILIFLLGNLLVLSQGRMAGFGYLFPLIWQGLYTFVVTSTVYYRLGGIRI